eukprot:TRINITY_DN11042_c1_g1_i1.p1 TRINITY_DN11042_c1_g1~~TRINITY_DN11042_c1_g1_i1.p1  ORF type:complete len:482 (+),score=38.70 TRINITY_DN11042_c1_g1_i1:58-1503(+)
MTNYGTNGGSGGTTHPPPLKRRHSSTLGLPKSSFVHYGTNSGKHLRSGGGGGAATESARKIMETSREETWWQQTKTLVFGDSSEGIRLLNTLLLAMLLSFPVYIFFDSPGWNFFLGFTALIPLAAILGDLTDDLACSLGDTWGALLNVTFGNATEVIICIAAIRLNLFDIIKASMLGSILGNMLLVLGSAFLAAGYDRKDFRFNRTGVSIYSSLLLLAVFALIIPTALAHLPTINSSLPFYKQQDGEHTVLLVSRCLSIIMVVCYCIFLYYQAVNKEHFEEGDEKPVLRKVVDEEAMKLVENESDDEEEDPLFTVSFAVTALAVCTVLISIESDIVVGALEPFAKSSGISRAFIAVILLPIVGNVCEHASAIIMAFRGKMDVAIGVAVGSSIQIATFVIPLLVVISWGLNGENPPPINGKPGALDLNFHPFCTVLILVAVLVVNTVINVEYGTWITGLFLCATYTMAAVCYWFVPANIEVM